MWFWTTDFYIYNCYFDLNLKLDHPLGFWRTFSKPASNFRYPKLEISIPECYASHPCTHSLSFLHLYMYQVYVYLVCLLPMYIRILIPMLSSPLNLNSFTHMCMHVRLLLTSLKIVHHELLLVLATYHCLRRLCPLPGRRTLTVHTCNWALSFHFRSRARTSHSCSLVRPIPVIGLIRPILVVGLIRPFPVVGLIRPFPVVGLTCPLFHSRARMSLIP